MPFAEFAEVYVARDPVEVSAVTAVLEGAGIAGRVRDMTITPYPVAFGPLGEKRILVPEEDAAQARRVLRRAIEDGVLSPQGIVVEERER